MIPIKSEGTAALDDLKRKLRNLYAAFAIPNCGSGVFSKI